MFNAACYRARPGQTRDGLRLMADTANRRTLRGRLLLETHLLYIIYQEDREDGAAIRAATRDAHFAYLDQHQDIPVLGGALLGDDATTRTGSVLIINVADRAAADAFSENEPFRRAGLFRTVKVSRMRRGQWNPDAAPKSAEGS